MEVSKTPLLRRTLLFLSLSGANPIMKNTFGIRDTLAIATFLATFFVVTSILIQIIVTWSGFKSVGFVMYFVGWSLALMKHVLFIVKRNELKRVIETLEDFWPIAKFGEGVEVPVEKIYKRAYLCNKVFLAFVFLNASVIISPAMRSEERTTLFLSYRFCDLENDLCYIAHSIWHLFSLFTIISSAVGFDMLFTVLVTYPYAGLEMVKYAFKEMNLLVKANVGELVEQHALILQFVKEFNGFMAIILMLQFGLVMWQLVVCWFMLGFHGFPLDANILAEYGVFAFTILLSLFIYSFGGTLIYEQALSVADAAFAVDWYHTGRTNLREELAFIIRRTQKITRLTVGHIYNLSLLLFVSTIRQSLSIFTLLRAISMTAEDESR